MGCVSTKKHAPRLEEQTAGMDLNTYIKTMVLDDEHKHRKNRNNNPVKDYQKLAVVLAMLGTIKPVHHPQGLSGGY